MTPIPSSGRHQPFGLPRRLWSVSTDPKTGFRPVPHCWMIDTFQWKVSKTGGSLRTQQRIERVAKRCPLGALLAPNPAAPVGQPVITARASGVAATPHADNESLLLQMMQDPVRRAFTPTDPEARLFGDAMDDAVHVSGPVAQHVENDQIVRPGGQVFAELVAPSSHDTFQWKVS